MDEYSNSQCPAYTGTIGTKISAASVGSDAILSGDAKLVGWKRIGQGLVWLLVDG